MIKKARTCKNCFGEGKVVVLNPSSKKHQIKTCPVCEGSGKVI